MRDKKRINKFKNYTLDNETSTILEETMKENIITFEYVPPNQHRCNAVERAIRTFKNHMLALWLFVTKTFHLDSVIDYCNNTNQRSTCYETLG